MLAPDLWGYLVGAIGMLVGAFGLLRNSRKDAEDGAKSNAAVLTELGYIKSGIDDLKRKQDLMERNFAEHGEHLAKVEASAKQAHKRMDDHLQYDHHKQVMRGEGN